MITTHCYNQIMPSNSMLYFPYTPFKTSGEKLPDPFTDFSNPGKVMGDYATNKCSSLWYLLSGVNKQQQLVLTGACMKCYI